MSSRGSKRLEAERLALGQILLVLEREAFRGFEFANNKIVACRSRFYIFEDVLNIVRVGVYLPALPFRHRPTTSSAQKVHRQDDRSELVNPR